MPTIRHIMQGVGGSGANSLHHAGGQGICCQQSASCRRRGYLLPTICIMQGDGGSAANSPHHEGEWGIGCQQSASCRGTGDLMPTIHIMQGDRGSAANNPRHAGGRGICCQQSASCRGWEICCQQSTSCRETGDFTFILEEKNSNNFGIKRMRTIKAFRNRKGQFQFYNSWRPPVRPFFSWFLTGVTLPLKIQYSLFESSSPVTFFNNHVP
jgi:hypothetical protein